MGSGHRKKEYKFTERRQSKKGIAALLLSAVSIAAFLYAVVSSFRHAGEGSIYLGSVGVFSMFLALVSFVLAVAGLRDEKAFKFFPFLAFIGSFLSAGVWIAVYVIGFLGL